MRRPSEPRLEPNMVDRRTFLGMAAGAGATLALTPELLRALQQSSANPIQRAIPSTGEKLPVVGLSFSNHAVCGDPVALKAVLKTFADNGARVFDAQHGNAAAEQFHATLASELGIQNKVFWSTGLSMQLRQGAPAPDAAAVKAQLDAVFTRLKVSKIDLMMIPASNPYFVSTALPTVLSVVKEAKKEGRIRYIGVSELPAPSNPYATLMSIMRNEPIDFIGVPHYHMANRAAEEALLPLAQERKLGVMVYMPFELSRLFQRTSNTPLPEWAAEFDAKTWAQFFLKYLVSHPAVTVVLPGTSSATHMLDNIGGGIGQLPNEATRKRMAELVDSFPPFQAPGQVPGRVTRPHPDRV